jgi:hypothetical protein
MAAMGIEATTQGRQAAARGGCHASKGRPSNAWRLQQLLQLRLTPGDPCQLLEHSRPQQLHKGGQII